MSDILRQESDAVQSHSSSEDVEPVVKENSKTDSTEDLDLTNLSIRRNSKTKKDKKGAPKTERSENTIIVLGEVETYEQFQELLQLVATQCGAVRSHYYRVHQHCGFVYFHDEETATKTKQMFDGSEFAGKSIKACAPIEYFDNELDAIPVPPSNRRASKELNTTPEQPLRVASDVLANAGDPACTLVLKNLNFNLKQDKLLEMLSQMAIPPQSVNYLYDENGNFRGVAFAKYKRVDEAARALELLSGLEIGKRKLRVEYKRRKSCQTPIGLSGLQLPPLHVPPTNPAHTPVRSASLKPAIVHESFDPGHMDTEQALIFSELLRFMDNPSLSDLNFPTSLTMGQRSQVHMIAEYLHLGHITIEANDSRYVVVTKLVRPDQQVQPQRRSARHLSHDGVVFPPMVQPQHLFQQFRGVASRQSAPKETFSQSKGPDDSNGFSFGRGRRVSTPTPTRVSRDGPPPPSNLGRASLRPTSFPGIARSQNRSASVPVVLVREGAEFA